VQTATFSAIYPFGLAYNFVTLHTSTIKEHTKRINETTQDNAIHYQP